MERDSVPLYHQSSVYPQIISKNNTDRPTQGLQAPSSALTVPLPANQNNMLLGPENTVTSCMFCHASIKTAVKYTTNSRTHIAAALWCMACCLCCVPYSSDSAKNSDHYCPNCERYLGTYYK